MRIYSNTAITYAHTRAHTDRYSVVLREGRPTTTNRYLLRARHRHYNSWLRKNSSKKKTTNNVWHRNKMMSHASTKFFPVLTRYRWSLPIQWILAAFRNMCQVCMLELATCDGLIWCSCVLMMNRIGAEWWYVRAQCTLFIICLCVSAPALAACWMYFHWLKST